MPVQQMYATGRGNGFFDANNQQQRVQQRKTSEMNGNVIRSSDLESIGGSVPTT